MENLNQQSEQLLLAVKLNNTVEVLINELASLSQLDLLKLKTDDQIIAFWINIYNAFYQILAISSQQNNGKEIYSLKEINLAGRKYSLDDIEHGILRRGKHKYSLGFWKSIWRYSNVRELRPAKIDYRIHFALNCGAKSCPPIASYSVQDLYEQLDQATISFLESDTSVNHQSKTIILSRIFLWFYNDFGRKKGIRYIIRKYLNQKIKGYQFKFSDYDWTQQLSNFHH